ncbi:uncharacterized protein LOC143600696, partial [Bidens hawaiensis]|uniref:uncharacterized protein LOC143600696 n=1 Tax=Bidens hawaiensis TaxID=980011 RepID=UPI00404B81E0
LEEQRKQQQLQEEQRKQQQLLEEQRKQQLLEEQRKQQQLQEEQQKLLEEQRKQQQLLEEQRKQQLLEEQRNQQHILEEQQRQQQLQEEQRKQQQLQEELRKQQEQQKQNSLNQDAAPVNNNGVREEETETEAETKPEPEDDSPTFWTACPYCFYMYEYPKLYVECTLRCENCKRAFQAVHIASPPPIIEGQDAYFYCWGFFPIGLSMSHLQDNKGTRSSNWTPFSSLHTTSNNQQNHLNEQAAPKQNPFVNKSSGPRIYIDDITDDV